MKRLAALLLAAPLTAGAMDYGEYTSSLTTEPGRAAVRVWLDGFGRGVGMYEQRQSMDGRGRRFCMPNGIRLSPELLAGLVDKVVKAQPQLARTDMGVEALVWVGLEAQFPCKPAKAG